jgi:hypothetical protein
MLLEHLYKLSLEHHKYWAMFFGLSVLKLEIQETRIDLFNSYIRGMVEAHRLAKISTEEIDNFFLWLRDVKEEFPTQGWDTKYYNDCGENHILAIEKFWGFLYEYVILTKPKWFVELNKKPLPSMLRRGSEGTPVIEDVRKPEHLKIVASL